MGREGSELMSTAGGAAVRGGESDTPMRATYQDVLDAPANRVAEISRCRPPSSEIFATSTAMRDVHRRQFRLGEVPVEQIWLDPSRETTSRRC